VEYVSLLPPEIKAKRKQEQKQRILIRAALVIFVIILIIYAYLLVGSIMARSNLESLQSERQLLENQAAALEEYEVLYNEMNTAENRLNMAMGEVPSWAEFMQDLGLTLPPGVWLSDMTVSFANETGTFNMRGWAYNHSGVAEMREEVEKMEQLNNLRIRTSTETTYNGQEVVQFVLDAEVLSGTPYIEVEETEPAEEEPSEEEED